jgi:drug/metabolite transporter (DMT)-like permease
MMMGQPAGLAVWAAVLTVLIGITVMAQSEGGTPVSDKRGAVGWSVAAALGFAISFGMLHSAALQAADLPVTFVARFVGFCGVLVWVISQRITIKPALALWPTLLLMGVLDMGGMIAVTSAGGFARPEFAAVSSSCFGLVTILLAWRFLGERLSLLQVFGGASIFAGIAVLGLL